MDVYEAPIVRDYGDLLVLTAAVAFTGLEDGGQKIDDIHHTGEGEGPSTPFHHPGGGLFG